MHHQRTVIVAVVAVRVMELTIAEVVVMVAMRYPFMTLRLVVTRAVHGRAGGGIGVSYRDSVLIIMVAMLEVQMTVMQIIDVALVLNRHVATLVVMNMWMVAGMDCVLHSVLLSERIDPAVSSLRFQDNACNKVSRTGSSIHRNARGNVEILAGGRA